MTNRELEAAVPAIRRDFKTTTMAAMVLGLIVVVAAFVALGLHSYLAPSPIYT